MIGEAFSAGEVDKDSIYSFRDAAADKVGIQLQTKKKAPQTILKRPAAVVNDLVEDDSAGEKDEEEDEEEPEEEEPEAPTKKQKTEVPTHIPDLSVDSPPPRSLSYEGLGSSPSFMSDPPDAGVFSEAELLL